jgi:hypothetical protein
MERYDLVPDLVTVISNTENIPGSKFGGLELHKTLSLFKNELPDVVIEFNLVSDIDISRDILENQMSFYRVKGAHNINQVFFNRSFFWTEPILSLKYKNGIPSIESNMPYSVWSAMRITKEEPAGSLVSDLIGAELIKKNYLPLHGACVANDDGAYVITAPPDTGKTYTTTMLLDQGYKYLAEDIVIASPSKKLVYAVPYTQTVEKRQPITIATPLNFIKKIFLGVLTGRSYGKKDIISAGMVSKDDFLTSKNIKKIFILEKGKSNKIRKAKINEAEKYMMNLNQAEFSYTYNNILRAYNYFNVTDDNVDLDVKERDLMRELLKNIPVYFVSSNSFRDYWEQIDLEILNG